MPGPMFEDPEFGWMMLPDLGVHGAELAHPIGFLTDFFASKRKQASPRGRARNSAPSNRVKKPARSTSNNRRSRK
jgi:hypothetical protein